MKGVVKMKLFYAYPQVKEAVETIKTLMKTEGKLPDVLVEHYRMAIAYGYRGAVIRFYELLAKECPEALHYFADVKKEEMREG